MRSAGDSGCERVAEFAQEQPGLPPPAMRSTVDLIAGGGSPGLLRLMTCSPLSQSVFKIPLFVRLDPHGAAEVGVVAVGVFGEELGAVFVDVAFGDLLAHAHVGAAAGDAGACPAATRC